ASFPPAEKPPRPPEPLPAEPVVPPASAQGGEAEETEAAAPPQGVSAGLPAPPAEPDTGAGAVPVFPAETTLPLSLEERTALHRSPVRFTDEDLVYLHAVSSIPPDQPPAETPFMLEEKGIDGRGFAFAMDHGGMRLYLSFLREGFVSVSKTGLLLAGKQESLQLRLSHELILNDLRLHGPLLPMEFGTVARGRDDLLGKLDVRREDLAGALARVRATTLWRVSLYVLDARIAPMVGEKEEPSIREARTVERKSYTKPVPARRYDVKTLERILTREKRLAESVHEELKRIALRSDVEYLIGLGGGSSEDWKLILRASYDLSGSRNPAFARGVADLQYRHLMEELMLAVTGDADAFRLKPG
ncbi:MAG: GvpL/GvpF family gas vesicle protein, partial [Bacteroidota bacterium]